MTKEVYISKYKVINGRLAQIREDKPAVVEVNSEIYKFGAKFSGLTQEGA